MLTSAVGWMEVLYGLGQGTSCICAYNNPAKCCDSASKELRWPDKNFKTSQEFLKSRSLGFSAGCENTTGKEFVRALQSVFFALQPHLKTLQGRKKPFILLFFDPIIETVCTTTLWHITINLPHWPRIVLINWADHFTLFWLFHGSVCGAWVWFWQF